MFFALSLTCCGCVAGEEAVYSYKAEGEVDGGGAQQLS